MGHDHEPLRVNFIEPNPERATRRQTYFLAGIFTIVVALVSAIGARASYVAVQQGHSVLDEVSHLSNLTSLRQLVFGGGSSDPLAQTPDNHLNFLILGIGGDGHDGPQLTDTILYASLDTQNHTVGLVSIPRDLAYPLGSGQFEKINAVNAYAEQDHPGEGAKYTADAFSKFLDVRIDHVVKIDFQGFVAFVDAIGGVDIDVERTFTDWQYPTWDDKWQTISFKKGIQHMDGQTALIYTRSRHGNNGEGSDFARSRRQQLVILAVQKKLLSVGTLTNPGKLAALYSAIATHIQTDLTPWDAVKLATIVPSISREQVKMNVLSDAPDGQLEDANVGGAFMLFPKKPDWSEVRAIAQNPFPSTTTTTSATSTVSTPPTIETARIELRNGTTRTGFASQIASKLEQNKFEVVSFGNAIRRGYEQTVIFDLTNGKKPQALNRLRNMLSATVSLTTPSWLASATSTSAGTVASDGLAMEHIAYASTDFLVILGEASYPLVSNTGVTEQ